MSTNYPSSIDNNVSLPQAIDLVTPVKAESVNNLRGAILAIEAELGINPSREYGTVRARLDTMQNTIDDILATNLLTVRQNGTLVYTPVNTLNFTDGLVCTHPGSCTVNVSAAAFLFLDGSRAMTGDLDMGTHYIHNVVDPIDPQDAASKNYVDGYFGVNNEWREILANGNVSGGTDPIISTGDVLRGEFDLNLASDTDGYVIISAGATEIVRFGTGSLLMQFGDSDEAIIGFPITTAQGADLTIRGQETTSGGVYGGDVTIISGDSVGYAGSVNILGGTGSSIGGSINITPGDSAGGPGDVNIITPGTSAGCGGSINLTTGNASACGPGGIFITAGNTTGGFGDNYNYEGQIYKISLRSEDGSTPATGGILLKTGDCSLGPPQLIRLKGGDTTAGAAPGGGILIDSGNGYNGRGGEITLAAGDSSENGSTGGNVNIGSGNGTPYGIINCTVASSSVLTLDGYTVDVETQRIIDVVDPIDPQDASTKNYVDGYTVGNVFNPSGFVNITDSTINADAGTRTFSIQPTVLDYDIYVYGTRYNKTALESVVWPDLEGIHHFYFDNTGTIQTTQISGTVNDIVAGDGSYISAIYWNADDGYIEFWADERHGINMSGDSHLHFHLAFGAQWISGGALSEINADASGDADNSATFSISTVTVRDEDLSWTWSDGSPQEMYPELQAPIYYLDGPNGDWRRKEADGYNVIYQNSVPGYADYQLAYNEWTGATWQLTEVTSGNCVLVHYFATNEINEPIIGILGQNQYNNVGLARTGAETEINELQQTADLLALEHAPLATVIWQTSSSYGNVPHARIRSTDEGDDYIDFRGNTRRGVGGVSGVIDHGNLSGLMDDDHVQYLLIDGTRAMTGDLNMDGNDINNIVNINAQAGSDLTLATDADGYVIITAGGTEVVRFGLGSSLMRFGGSDDAIIEFPEISGAGHSITINAQSSSSSSGGNLLLNAGRATAAGQTPGGVTIKPGYGNFVYSAGNILVDTTGTVGIAGGGNFSVTTASSTGSRAGNVLISTGGTTGGDGSGTFTVQTGDTTSGSSGDISLLAGDYSTIGNGASLIVRGGNFGLGDTGGDVEINAGNGEVHKDAGNVIITSGTSSGSGYDGYTIVNSGSDEILRFSFYNNAPNLWFDDAADPTIGFNPTPMAGLGTVLNITGKTSDNNNGGDINVTSGGGFGNGGILNLVGGSGIFGSGGTVFVDGGASGSSAGGGVYVRGGLGGGGLSGSVQIESRANAIGSGNIIVQSGNVNTSGNSGYVNITSGTNTGTGTSGDINILAGDSSSDVGGSLNLHAGNSGLAQANVNIYAGTGGVGYNGGDVTIKGGPAGAGAIDGYIVFERGSGEIFRIDEALETTRLFFDAALPEILITQDNESAGVNAADLIIKAQSAVYPRSGGDVILSSGGGNPGSIKFAIGSPTSNTNIQITNQGYLSWAKDCTGIGLIVSSETSGHAQDMEISAQASSSGNGGDLNLTGGTSTGSNGIGGDLDFRAGGGNGSGNGGSVYLYSGAGGTTGSGGNIWITAYNGTGVGDGGDINVKAGNGGVSGDAGNVVIACGTGSSNNGYVSIRDNTDDIVLFGEDLGTDPTAGFYFSKSNNGANPNALRARSPNSLITTVAPNGTDDGYTQEVIFEVGTVTTSDANETTCLSFSIATDYYGKITIDVTAEDQADPQNAYGYSNTFLISNDSGTVNIRDASLAPTEQDPQSTGVSATLDASGATVRIRVTGNVGENWAWTGMINGLLCERSV